MTMMCFLVVQLTSLCITTETRATEETEVMFLLMLLQFHLCFVYKSICRISVLDR